jgi:hypothetical protein
MRASSSWIANRPTGSGENPAVAERIHRREKCSLRAWWTS